MVLDFLKIQNYESLEEEPLEQLVFCFYCVFVGLSSLIQNMYFLIKRCHLFISCEKMWSESFRCAAEL